MQWQVLAVTLINLRNIPSLVEELSSSDWSLGQPAVVLTSLHRWTWAPRQVLYLGSRAGSTGSSCLKFLLWLPYMIRYTHKLKLTPSSPKLLLVLVFITAIESKPGQMK